MEEKRINLADRLFILAVVFAFGVLIYLFGLLYKEFKYPAGSLQFFNVKGEGKVYALPDVALLTIGVRSEGMEVSKIIDENTKKVNNILKEIKALGIEDKDIQTIKYSLDPRYDYLKEGQRVFRGYILDQRLTIKIRDFTKIGQVIQKATEFGTNLIDNLEFNVDNLEKYKREARKIAIENAQEKAKEISEVAGLKLKRLVNAYENFHLPPLYYEERGFGGAVAFSEAIPQIKPGQQEITVNVTLIYEVK